MALAVVPVDAEFLWQAIGMEIDMPVKAYVGVENKAIIGAGGLAWGEGRCWLWLQIFDLNHKRPVYVVRWARRLLKVAAQLGERDVYTPRDDEYPSSQKLLKCLGFEFFETDKKTGKEIHVWRLSQ